MAKIKVFIDANIVIHAGKPPGGPIMLRIADLVRAGLIEVLTTDLTVSEVARKHADNDYEVVKEVGRPHFRRLVKEYLETDLPEISKADLKASLSKKYGEAVEGMFRVLRAKTLAVDEVKPSTVLGAYSEGSGFFSGEAKKGQFPDAFIFECLRAEATEKSPVVIVSNDADFDAPVRGAQHISLIKSITALFQRLGLEVDAPEVEEFLDGQNDVIVEIVNERLNDSGLQVFDVDDAEILESEVTAVELSDLISFGSTKEGGSILVVGTAQITTTISYTHPNWDNAMWDSEDKVAIPFEDVSGEKEVSLEAEFSMTISVDSDGNPANIDDLIFRDDNALSVELYPYETYK